MKPDGGVTLRAVRLTDAPYFERWSEDPETRRLQAGRRTPMSPAEAEEFVLRLVQEEGASHVARMIDVGDVTVGNCWLGNLDRANASATLGIVIGDSTFRGRGIGTEAVEQLLSIGFEQLRLERVELWTLASNERAIRAYEKVGFEREGIRRGHLLWDGVRHDTVLMGRLEDDRARD